MSISTEMDEEEFQDIDVFVKQKSLVEPVVTAQNLFSIYQCPDQQMYRARVQFLFNLEQYVEDQMALETILDMVHGAILFASDNDFAYPKAIVFLSIYMAIFQLTISTPFYSPQELFNKSQDLLLAHSIDRPPFSALIFELHDIDLINNFLVDTFFRNIKLIQNCFTRKPVVVFNSVFPTSSIIPQIPPLAEMELEEPEPESTVVSNLNSIPNTSQENIKINPPGSGKKTSSRLQSPTSGLLYTDNP